MQLKKLASLLQKWEAWVYTLIAFLFYTLLLSEGSYLPDRDAYFHISIASQMLQTGWVQKIPQLAHTIHAGHYIDVHFVFHLALVPFVILTGWNLIWAFKLATIVFCSVAASSFVLLLKSTGIKNRWFWFLFFIAGSSVFTGRLLFGRGITLYLVELIWLLYALRHSKFKLAIFLSFISVWTYPGFMIGFLFVLFWMVSLLLNRSKFSKNEIIQIVFIPLATLLGIIIHPSFPDQFYGYFLEIILHSVKPEQVESIAEWEAPIPRVLLESYLALFCILIPLLISSKRRNYFNNTLLVMVFILLPLSFRSQKSLEYSVFFMLLFVALQSKNIPTGTFKSFITGLVLFIMIAFNIPRIYNGMQVQFSHNNPQPAFNMANYLKNNTDTHSKVLLSWDEFPYFYYKNRHNIYAYGLNPIYSYGANYRDYLILKNFNRGLLKDFKSLKNSYKFDYIVANKFKQKLALQNLRSSSQVILLHENPKYIMYKIK